MDVKKIKSLSSDLHGLTAVTRAFEEIEKSNMADNAKCTCRQALYNELERLSSIATDIWWETAKDKEEDEDEV